MGYFFGHFAFKLMHEFVIMYKKNKNFANHIRERRYGEKTGKKM